MKRPTTLIYMLRLSQSAFTEVTSGPLMNSTA
jgi:hypothetical protein